MQMSYQLLLTAGHDCLSDSISLHVSGTRRKPHFLLVDTEILECLVTINNVFDRETQYPMFKMLPMLEEAAQVKL